MFGSMRRKDRELSAEAAQGILARSKYGILSVICANGYPNGVPIHYVMLDGKIYFHSTSEGGIPYAANKMQVYEITVQHLTEKVVDKPAAIRNSARCLFFYKEDSLPNQVMGLFTDPAATALASGVDATLVASLREKLKGYP